jgi:hypothetical protein
VQGGTPHKWIIFAYHCAETLYSVDETLVFQQVQRKSHNLTAASEGVGKLMLALKAVARS